MKRLAGFVLAAAALLAAAAWLYGRPRADVHKASFVIFGGLTDVELRGVPPAAAAAAFGAIGEQLQRDQRAWHPWEMSDLMRLNAAIAQDLPYQASPELAGLLRSAQQGYVRSQGLFNAAIGSLVGLWGFHTSDYPITTPPPPQSTIDTLLATRPRMDDISVAEDGTVTSRNRHIQLDLNGLAEGYAAEQIAALLKRQGIANALINVGGDVLALGQADERPWRVGISSPQHQTLAGVELRGHEALFSSGNYNKFREREGERWGHVLDPRDGRPARGVAAVSVIHTDAVVADVASTSLMIGGAEGLEALARSLGVSCVLLVADDGTVWVSPAMQQRLTFTTPPQNLRLSADLGGNCAGSRPQPPAPSAAPAATAP
ncbi:FAD:protein FMN transferase [Tahibacter harae]|uniref:FAD:protein FMN transferase n=1 Tax=Tahibacter harae TaxID=2963937 RepID=A0ABT1QR33_9GAMM|nr:FAD:protein FMN transferase [Tahibacter harae]MCQ4164725.1 FAD:protein FMN transferase [Tahibacter harae]